MSLVAEDKLIRTLSPHEQMGYPGLDHYFNTGRSGLNCVYEGLAAAGRVEAGASPYGVERILDLPCGQGRVIRWFRMAFPDAEIAACDMSREGVDFCAETFNAVPIYSVEDPEKIPLPQDHYDLIWVGSLFTHLEASKWPRFLKAFHDALRPGGVVVFTTHGTLAHKYMAERIYLYGHVEEEIASLLADFDRNQFGYSRYGFTDWDYGTSLSTTEWVENCVRGVGGLSLVHHVPNQWDDHQDCFTCRRDV